MEPFRILFLGDIVGEPGRKAVIEHLPGLRKELQLDFIIVNGENAAGGRGITPRIAIDLLRALRKADAAAALAHELAPAKGMHPALDRLAAQLPIRVEEMASEMEARRLAQDVALAVQAALLAQTAPTAVFSAFCDSRIGGEWGYSFGSLGAGVDFDAILTRAMPH